MVVFVSPPSRCDCCVWWCQIRYAGLDEWDLMHKTVLLARTWLDTSMHEVQTRLRVSQPANGGREIPCSLLQAQATRDVDEDALSHGSWQKLMKSPWSRRFWCMHVVYMQEMGVIGASQRSSINWELMKRRRVDVVDAAVAAVTEEGEGIDMLVNLPASCREVSGGTPAAERPHSPFRCVTPSFVLT